MSESNVQIHDVVKERYGSIATSGGSCCGDSGCCGDTGSVRLYNDTTLEGLPEDVVNLSLGCGDPVSIASLREGETVLDLGSGGGIDCFSRGAAGG